MSPIEKLDQAHFPALLKEITDPPKQLYLEGELPSDELVHLTVVGSRRPSRYGQEVAEHLVTGLAGQPVAIVSGLAIGLDTIAHNSALKVGLPTIAVPGSGLDRSVLHPPSNRRLADKIVSSGGALLSELSLTEPAGIHTFPRRNRIMAGLSQAVLVVEAGERSGTLITSRLALDYNRDVLAVPGSIFSPTSKGANDLIRQGASVIASSGDLLLALGFEPEEKASGQAKLLELAPPAETVRQLLAVEPLARDDLIKCLKLSAQEVIPILAMMELKGLIKEEMGEFRLTGR